VRNLRGGPLAVIVIVTAFDEYAIEAFDAGAIDYLLKPVSEARLRKAVERAQGLTNKPLQIANAVAMSTPVENSPFRRSKIPHPQRLRPVPEAGFSHAPFPSY
jgi:DNA-binding LytR/AlgR family response regulator